LIKSLLEDRIRTVISKLDYHDLREKISETIEQVVQQRLLENTNDPSRRPPRR
jgi:Tfp pilus assembly pilus retraction ATPase PilT